MNIVLGISGGIAAYKTPELVRRLKERGAAVVPVMTGAFSLPLTSMETVWLTDSPSAVVAVTVKVSVMVSPPARLCAAALSRL